MMSEYPQVDVKREVKIDLSSIWTAEGLRRAVRATGSYFFEPDTMRFFNSRLSPFILHTERGLLFITSEQFVSYYPEYHKEPRQYTLRILHEDGEIDEIGEFGQYDSLRQAKSAAKKYAEFVAIRP